MACAKRNDADGAARQWIKAAEMSAKDTTSPALLAAQRSLGVNLDKVSDERSLSPAPAAKCREWAEWIFDSFEDG